jgi:hypothetical protein
MQMYAAFTGQPPRIDSTFVPESGTAAKLNREANRLADLARELLGRAAGRLDEATERRRRAQQLRGEVQHVQTRRRAA